MTSSTILTELTNLLQSSFDRVYSRRPFTLDVENERHRRPGAIPATWTGER